MANKKVSTPVPPVVLCQYCGKPIKAGTHGALCAKNTKAGYTQTIRLQLKAALSYTTAPVGYVTVAQAHKVCTANLVPIPHLVKAIGGDGVTGKPLHAITAPVYVGNNRYISGWLITKAGITALQTYNFTNAPVQAWQTMYYNYVLACQTALLGGKPTPTKPVLGGA